MLQLHIEPSTILTTQRNTVELCFTNKSDHELSQIQLTFRLPNTVRLWRGGTDIFLSRLSANTTKCFPMIIETDIIGTHKFEQPLLTYVTINGPVSVEPNGLLYVVAMAVGTAKHEEQGKVQLILELRVDHVQHNEWISVQAHLHNNGSAPAANTQFSIRSKAWQLQAESIPYLPPHSSRVVQLYLRSLAIGWQQIEIAADFIAPDGRNQSQSWIFEIDSQTVEPENRERNVYINTGGGTYVGRDVNVKDGDFTGKDAYVNKSLSEE